MNASVYLHNAAGSYLEGDDRDGPEYDAFISHYEITSSGTYYARVYSDTYWGGGSATGTYELRVDVARGIDLESDTGYSNDSISGANTLTLTVGDPGHKMGVVAGTVMSPDSWNTDEDVFLLGTLSAGNVVELTTTLPSSSTLVARVRLLDASGTEVTDEY